MDQGNHRSHPVSKRTRHVAKRPPQVQEDPNRRRNYRVEGVQHRFRRNHRRNEIEAQDIDAPRRQLPLHPLDDLVPLLIGKLLGAHEVRRIVRLLNHRIRPLNHRIRMPEIGHDRPQAVLGNLVRYGERH